MTEILDMFGFPVPPRRGERGRPQHLPNRETRGKVSLGTALGWSNDRIAAALGITLPTLRKHYFSELKVRMVARDRLDLAVMESLSREAIAGNVGAARELGRRVERNDMMTGHRDFYDGQRKPAADDAKPEKLGKKEAAVRAAEAAGDNTEWGDDLRPQTH